MSLLQPEPCPWHFFSIPHLFWPPYLQAVSKNRAKLWYQCKHNVKAVPLEHWALNTLQTLIFQSRHQFWCLLKHFILTSDTHILKCLLKIVLSRRFPQLKQCKLTSFKCLLGEQPRKIKVRWKQMPLATYRRGQCMWEGNMDKCCLDAGWGKAPLADTCLNPNWDPGLSSGSHWFKKGPTISVSLYPETFEFIWLHN